MEGSFQSLPPPPTTSPQTKTQRIQTALENGDWTELRRLALEKDGFGSEDRKKVWSFLLSSSSTTSLSPSPPSPKLRKLTPTSSPLSSFVLPSPPHSENPPTLEGDYWNFKDLPEHKDEGQIKKDIDRSFVSWPEDVSDEDKKRLRAKLEVLIVSILRRHPTLNYFQGYHDILSIFILTFQPTSPSHNPQSSSSDPTSLSSSPAQSLILPSIKSSQSFQPIVYPELDQELWVSAKNLTLFRIRDSLSKDLEPVMGYLRVVKKIVVAEDPELGHSLETLANLPYFSLSWVLTLLSHDLESLSAIQHIFDFLLSYPPEMVCYLGAALILTQKELVFPKKKKSIDSDEEKEILEKELGEVEDGDEFEDEEMDPGVLHSKFSKLPKLVEEELEKPSKVSSDEASPLMQALKEEEMSLNAETRQLPTPAPESPSIIDHSDFSSDLDSPHIFTDAMLLDPTVSPPEYIPSPSRSPPSKRRRKSKLTTSAPSSVSIVKVMKLSLALWERYPLQGDKIKGNDIMGPKSAIFTWRESGGLSEEEAEKIVASGKDVVIPEILPPPPSKPRGINKKPRRGLNPIKFGLSHFIPTQVDVGTVLTVVGVAGVVIAILASEKREEIGWLMKEWGTKGLEIVGKGWTVEF